VKLSEIEIYKRVILGIYRNDCFMYRYAVVWMCIA